MEKRAYEEYIKGKITLSQAAKSAELTIWEMENFGLQMNALDLMP